MEIQFSLTGKSIHPQCSLDSDSHLHFQLMQCFASLPLADLHDALAQLAECPRLPLLLSLFLLLFFPPFLLLEELLSLVVVAAVADQAHYGQPEQLAAPPVEPTENGHRDGILDVLKMSGGI